MFKTFWSAFSIVTRKKTPWRCIFAFKASASTDDPELLEDPEPPDPEAEEPNEEEEEEVIHLGCFDMAISSSDESSIEISSNESFEIEEQAGGSTSYADVMDLPTRFLEEKDDSFSPLPKRKKIDSKRNSEDESDGNLSTDSTTALHQEITDLKLKLDNDERTLRSVEERLALLERILENIEDDNNQEDEPFEPQPGCSTSKEEVEDKCSRKRKKILKNVHQKYKAELLKYIYCPICYKTMQDSPALDFKILNCCHIVCEPCFNRLVESILDSEIKCPICKDKIFVNSIRTLYL